jgi:hypothetical protein
MAQKKELSLKVQGLAQAGGVAVYCSLIGLIFWKANEIFGKMANYAGPVAFLLLFIVSALICAAMVFYKPYVLFFDNKKKEAVDLVLYTTGFLFFFFVVFLSLAVFLR